MVCGFWNKSIFSTRSTAAKNIALAAFQPRVGLIVLSGGRYPKGRADVVFHCRIVPAALWQSGVRRPRQDVDH